MAPPLLVPDTRKTPCTGQMLSDLIFPHPKPTEKHPSMPQGLEPQRRELERWAPEGAKRDPHHRGAETGPRVTLPRLVQGSGVLVSENTSTGGMEARQQEELPWTMRAAAPQRGLGRCPTPPPPYGFQAGVGGSGGGRWRLPGRR